jgi:hypothetical protein
VTGRAWLWPDHVIGKREARRLREEHNAAVNERADLLAALQSVLDSVPFASYRGDGELEECEE